MNVQITKLLQLSFLYFMFRSVGDGEGGLRLTLLD